MNTIFIVFFTIIILLSSCYPTLLMPNLQHVPATSPKNELLLTPRNCNVIIKIDTNFYFQMNGYALYKYFYKNNSQIIDIPKVKTYKHEFALGYQNNIQNFYFGLTSGIGNGKYRLNYEYTVSGYHFIQPFSENISAETKEYFIMPYTTMNIDNTSVSLSYRWRQVNVQKYYDYFATKQEDNKIKYKEFACTIRNRYKKIDFLTQFQISMLQYEPKNNLPYVNFCDNKVMISLGAIYNFGIWKK